MTARRCFLEWKTFDLRRNQEYISFTERGKGRTTSVTIHEDAASWLAASIPEKEIAPNILHARMRKNNLTISLMPRSNEWGIYMSILFISKNLERGSKILRIPLDADKAGWKTFKELCVDVCRDPKRVDVALEPMGGVNQVLIKKGFEDEAGALKERCVIINSEQGLEWNRVPQDLNEIVHLSKVPTISQVGINTFKLEMGNKKDVSILMKVPKLILSGKEVTFSRWSPNVCTLDRSWIQKKDRWIDFEGLPVHLRVTVVLKELCKTFGKVAEVRVSDIDGLSTVRALVKECDLTLMPHVIAINEQNVVSPVRLMVHCCKEIVDATGREGDQYNRYVPDPDPENETWPRLIGNGCHQPTYRETLIRNSNSENPSHPDNQCSIPSIAPSPPIIRSIVRPNPGPSNSSNPVPNFSPSSKANPSFPFAPVNTNDLTHVSPTNTSTCVFPHQTVTLVPNQTHNPIIHTQTPSSEPLNRATSYGPSPIFANTKVSSFHNEAEPPMCALGQGLDATQNSSWADGAPKQPTQGIPNTGGSEDDGLVSDSGDESSHCAENLEDQVEIVQSEDVANLISKKLTEIKDILKVTETNSETNEPSITKKGRKIGTRSRRRRTRADILLQAEEMN